MRLASCGILIAPLLLAAACDPTSPAPTSTTTIERLGAWVPGPASTILHTSQSSLRYPTFEIVTDTASWQRVWNQTWSDSPLAPRRPNLDFVLTSVIVLGLGNRVGPGYSVSIDSIVVYSGGPILFATEVQPDSPCAGTATSAPVHMVWIVDHPPPMEYRVARVRRPCPA